jgi:hypothetical protein
LAKSFNWQFQEGFQRDKRGKGRDSQELLDISSNDEYSAISVAIYFLHGSVKSSRCKAHKN